jgi:SGNH domain-containing protein
LAGAGLAYRSQIILTSRLRSWISLGGAVSLLISAALFTPELRFPGWLALLPVAGTVAIILAGREAGVNRTILSTRAAVFVGLISYPLYLWHWPLISYAYIIRLGKTPTPLMAAGLVVVSFLLAWATYRFIEYPVRFGVHRHRRTQIVIACMVALGAAGLATWTLHGFPSRFPTLPGLDMRKISEARNDPVFQPTRGMDVLNHDTTLVAHLGQGDRKLALSGDSVLFQFGPRVQELADQGQLHANVYFVIGGSCAPLPGMIQQGDFAHCANMPGILLDLVHREEIKTVVLGASWAGYGGDTMRIEREGKRMSLTDPEGRDTFYANLEDYVRLLRGWGADVYLVLGVPADLFRFDPNHMIARGLTGFNVSPGVDQDVPVAELRAAYAKTDRRLRGIAQNTGAILLDAFPDVCGSNDGCSPFFGAAEPKYVDGLHLRPAFVRAHVHFLDFLLR